jgi:hypothetical protein
MIAKKIMKTHMTDDDHAIHDIVENLASRLYFHGHPINRKEARNELHLKVLESPQPELELAMWELYKSYEEEFKNGERLRIVDELMSQAGTLNSTGQPTQPIVLEHNLLFASIESAKLSSKYISEKRYVLTAFDQVGNPQIREETKKDGWDHRPMATLPRKRQSAS